MSTPSSGRQDGGLLCRRLPVDGPSAGAVCRLLGSRGVSRPRARGPLTQVIWAGMNQRERRAQRKVGIALVPCLRPLWLFGEFRNGWPSPDPYTHWYALFSRLRVPFVSAKEVSRARSGPGLDPVLHLDGLVGACGAR
jgi:hypothetical protein